MSVFELRMAETISDINSSSIDVSIFNIFKVKLL